ncbi:hypothetical protein ACOSQ2_033193 [Xanthoceras sorbifolium]
MKMNTRLVVNFGGLKFVLYWKYRFWTGLPKKRTILKMERREGETNLDKLKRNFGEYGEIQLEKNPAKKISYNNEYTKTEKVHVQNFHKNVLNFKKGKTCKKKAS